MLPYLLSIKLHWQDNAAAGLSTLDCAPRRTSPGWLTSHQQQRSGKDPASLIRTCCLRRRRGGSGAVRSPQSAIWLCIYSFGQGDCGRRYCPHVHGWLELTTSQSKEENSQYFPTFTHLSPSSSYSVLINLVYLVLTPLINHLNKKKLKVKSSLLKDII